MATPISPEILNWETDARFWAQTRHKPGQKLDPNNPTDKAMIPVWKDIFRKVKAEADAGTLVTTYDHPEIAQNLADATVASTVAATHAAAAAAAADPTTAQQHTEAAATAAQVAVQKAAEAAGKQPPTVSSQLVQEASKEAAKTPPPPSAPAADQIAHQQMLRPEDDPWDPRYVKPASKSPRETTASPSPQLDRRLIDATNDRFWRQTHYKPGQRLDMSDAQDRQMAKIWMEILQQVQREASAGTLPPPTPRPPIAQPPTPPAVTRPPAPLPPPRAPQAGPMYPQYPQYPQMPGRPGMMQPPMGPQMPGRPGMQPPGMQPPMGPQMPGRPGMQHPGMQPPMGPQMPPPMGPRPGAPAGAPSTAMPGGPPAGTPEAPADVPSPPIAERPSIGKLLAIGVAVIAGGGLLYYATTRTPSRRTAPRPRTPKVIVATPTRSFPARATPARSARPALPGLPPARSLRP